MVSRNAEILIPEVVGIDGDVKVKVTVKPNADAGEPYWLLENNTAESGSFVFVEKRVYLNPGEVLLAEESSQYAEFSLTRSGLASEPETFRITLPADTRFTFPQSVTIPAGDSGVYFYVSVKPDNALNENQTLLSHWKVTATNRCRHRSKWKTTLSRHFRSLLLHRK